jgi:hypothetical protein
MSVPNHFVRPSASYCSYLVRLWRDQPDAPWRASAQHVQTGETVRFIDLDSLCQYLMHHATDQCDAELSPRPSDGVHADATGVGLSNPTLPTPHP